MYISLLTSLFASIFFSTWLVAINNVIHPSMWGTCNLNSSPPCFAAFCATYSSSTYKLNYSLNYEYIRQNQKTAQENWIICLQ